MGVNKGWAGIGRRLLAVFLAVVLGWSGFGCAKPTAPKALLAEPGDRTNRLGGQLEEVSPPETLQTLKQIIDAYEPQVRILSPRPGEVLEGTTASVRFQVRGLPLFKDQKWGLGPHLHVFLDDEPYRDVYDLSEPLELSDLAPGTHTLRTFAVRPWNEGFKNQGAFDQRTFHVFAQTPQKALDKNQPLLTYSQPQGTYGAEPILLDFYLTNAPLHMIAQENSQDSIADWRIRCTVNGQSFVFDQWQPVYLKGFKPGQNWIQLELIDEEGDLIDNTFNNTVRVITYEPGGEDALSKLVRGELTLKEVAGIIDPTYVPPVEPEPEVVEPEPLEEGAPEVAPSTGPDLDEAQSEEAPAAEPEQPAPPTVAPVPSGILEPKAEESTPDIQVPTASSKEDSKPPKPAHEKTPPLPEPTPSVPETMQLPVKQVPEPPEPETPAKPEEPVTGIFPPPEPPLPEPKTDAETAPVSDSLKETLPEAGSSLSPRQEQPDILDEAPTSSRFFKPFQQWRQQFQQPPTLPETLPSPDLRELPGGTLAPAPESALDELEQVPDPALPEAEEPLIEEGGSLPPLEQSPDDVETVPPFGGLNHQFQQWRQQFQRSHTPLETMPAPALPEATPAPGPEPTSDELEQVPDPALPEAEEPLIEEGGSLPPLEQLPDDVEATPPLHGFKDQFKQWWQQLQNPNAMPETIPVPVPREPGSLQVPAPSLLEPSPIAPDEPPIETLPEILVPPADKSAGPEDLLKRAEPDQSNQSDQEGSNPAKGSDPAPASPEQLLI